MRFDPSFLDEIRGRVHVSDVVARRVKLKRQGREFVGLSPFKVEKTPSFTVNDQKGFYHCFASGEHGDVFTFLMKTEGLSFPEAVEQLAGEAGVPMPVQSAEQVAQEKTRDRLYDVMNASVQFFKDCLNSSDGRDAREYLDRRGVSVAQQEKFQLGYAPGGRTVLKEHLLGAGFHPEELEACGMVIFGEDIAVSYDRFRHRIMFPIADLKGRVIAFGGRALDPTQPAKYLNSPETKLFHKGHVLFNAAQARQAAYDRGTVIAVEGYMDVIALDGANIANSVAPLGTALTENQLKLMWRMAHEPVLCFDGDGAGRKAAYRAVETALPHLTPGYSLRFAFLPEGQDPDDLVRHEGGAALENLIQKARPLAEVLFNKEWEAGEWSTPERRAALEQTLRGLVRQIGDPTVRGHYEMDLKERLQKIWASKLSQSGSNHGNMGRSGFQGSRRQNWQRGGKNGRFKTGFGGQRGGFAPSGASEALKSSSLVRGERSRLSGREALLIKTVVNHPWLIDEYSEEIAGLEFEATSLKQLRNAILEIHILQNSLDRDILHTQLSGSGQADVLAQVERAITHKSDGFAEPHAPRECVEVGWRHILGLHRKMLDLKRELEAAERNFQADDSEENFARLRQIRHELSSAEGTELPSDVINSGAGLSGNA